jgi:uncharacterized phage protein (TIGR01671 family)
MRTIKFRAMTHNNNIMVFGDLINTPENDNRIIWFDEKTTYNERVQTSTIGQFIGLIDKNGKEIYEGDIMKFITNGFDAETFVTTIIFDKCSFKLSNNRSLFYFGQSDLTRVDDGEVIGNIYQNPELLSTPTAVL